MKNVYFVVIQVNTRLCVDNIRLFNITSNVSLKRIMIVWWACDKSDFPLGVYINNGLSKNQTAFFALQSGRPIDIDRN
jgi:hypothetical protein